MLGENPNTLFEILEDWEYILQAENIDFDQLEKEASKQDEGVEQ